MTAHPHFKLPTPASTLNGRKTTLTGLFIASMIPVVEPSDADVDEALAVLGMSRERCECAYCGREKTEWDHFFPVVKRREPTGYITEISNLVPCCSKCNQSKRNEYWKTWMLNPRPPQSPTHRAVEDISLRIDRLEAFERWRPRVCLPLEQLVGRDRWSRHMSYLDEVLTTLKEAEAHAAVLRQEIKAHLSSLQF